MDKRDLALSFADDPELYDLVRVGYPDELFKCLLDKVQIKEHHRVLEIGPGSGKLTQHLLNLGNQVVGLEPAEAFVKFLKGKFKEQTNLSICNIPFEELEADRNHQYDLVICAQAFHWIGWEVGLPKIKEILALSGSLALIWYSAELIDKNLCAALDSVYQKYPTVVARLPGSFTQKWQDSQPIVNAGFFKNLSVFELRITHRHTSLEYELLASTQSQYKKLAPSDRKILLRGAADIIKEFGGFIDVEYKYWLCTAQLA